MEQVCSTGDRHICRWCGLSFSSTPEESAGFIVSGGSCPSCSDILFKSLDKVKIREAIEPIDEPVLVLQADPRLVFTANSKATGVFNKQLSRMEGFRGGQVFDCTQSFTEAGCGKDISCENCKIKQMIVDTLSTGNSFKSDKIPLDVKRGDIIIPFVLQISTEKTGDLALVRIDTYEPA